MVEQILVRPAGAADRFAQHLARGVVRAIDAVPEAVRVATGIEEARRLIDQSAQRLPQSGSATATPADPASVLSAIGEWRPDGSIRMLGRPLILLLDTTLLTNAPASRARAARATGVCGGHIRPTRADALRGLLGGQIRRTV